MANYKLGNSDLYISRIGFGAWAAGGGNWEFSWGPQDDRESIAAIHRALELGINWIDTAAVYGLGHSEDVVAQALREWSGPRPYIFTKCALIWEESGRVRRNHSSTSIRKECEDSLRRLQIDSIDLYQIHWPPYDGGVGIEEAWRTLAELQKEGKVRWIGVSNFNVAQLQRAARIAPVTSLQAPYSILRPKSEEELLPHCRRNNIGVLAYSPMFSGLLSGGMTRERAATLPTDDFRRRNPEFREPKLSKNLELVEQLKSIGARYGRGAGEVAIAWVLREPSVTGAIVGVRSPKQAEGVMRAGDFRLSQRDVAEIEEFANNAARVRAAVS